ncbi:MAG: peptide chain release factor N(5)-glutamine methyltransferase [Prevotella sp.]
MTYSELWSSLSHAYDAGEAKAIVRYVLEVRFGMSVADVFSGKVTQLTADDSRELKEIMRRLADAEPVQYVLGCADFGGRSYAVKPGVLIPRPETEDLCTWLCESAGPGAHVLDIGTGSGCIAISAALDMDDAVVEAWDVSDVALEVARANAGRLGAEVRFVRQDALEAPQEKECRDIIVSNPPYVCMREKETMERNVLDYEPHSALFVPDDDPLLFYRKIALYAGNALRRGGFLLFEINPLFATELTAMLRDTGFDCVESRNDRFGKVRFVRARKAADTGNR